MRHETMMMMRSEAMRRKEITMTLREMGKVTME